MANNQTLTEQDLNYIEQRLSNIFATKEEIQKYKSEILNSVDRVLKEVIASRQEQKILVHKSVDHETRITSLEEIHPRGQHTTA